ncbi:ATP-dependent helicase [Shewanella baltica]|uniref:ATP-dependent helicase n=1 Tax=Shewanella baltica TaxID=62322 RepID=UPI00014F9012|nr:ATP-dependent helicase [Shewanella baltica]ABS10393.1 UvrD/REP helicase [Shewanella baltica OS185]EHC07396.1 UvrD/REP helicase [Shewanella baltica OS625]MCS6129155.1 ATP-dependent helicase [Shewanella baltica]MCS6141085.1 ATP-dependent helicase [Shewanella baltica]MCS6147369.1 ATP-dependent helicase [Shewanella baltica]
MIRHDNWKPADGLTLEPNAERAVKECEKNLALTAGPGAGKTEMLAQRADFLLRTGTCRYPKRILAISFKVDASSNLKDRVTRRSGDELSSRFDSYTFHAFAKRIIDRFRPILTGIYTLDSEYTIGSPRTPQKQIEFADLVPLATRILQSSAVARNAIRQTYTDVFLDEFQDCTDIQYEFLKIAFQSTTIRLTAVGDTKQKIMGWAGALDGIFVTYAQDFQALPLNMYRNFRSKPQLLRLQNEIIRTLDPASVMPNELIVGNEGEIRAFQFETSQREAEYLAEQIQNWIIVDNIPPNEIAILIRNQPHLYAQHLIPALRNRQIPFRNEQELQDITVEPAARLIVDFLLCTFGKREPAAWLRLMNQLIPFTDDEEEQDKYQQIWLNFIQRQRKRIRENPITIDNQSRWQSVQSFIELVGIETMTALSHDYETASRLNEVLRATFNKLDETLASGLTLLEALCQFTDDQSVRILTSHKSKGLEFDTVVLLGIENECYFGAPQENLCTFFVGVSRAKCKLLLTFAKERIRPEGFSGRWSEQRTLVNEYAGYVRPFLSNNN